MNIQGIREKIGNHPLKEYCFLSSQVRKRMTRSEESELKQHFKIEDDGFFYTIKNKGSIK
jgi:hypothetical protein